MAPRLPTAEDFPAHVVVSIVPPPDSKPPAALLILLHGLGDTNAPFTGLARQMNLPETVCLSIQAPKPLPFDLGGFHWGEDIIFDQTSGKMDFDTGFRTSANVLSKVVIRDVLITKCDFKARDIVLFGFGQGAMTALSATQLIAPEELAGVIDIGGPLPNDVTANRIQHKAKTPILLLHGSSHSLITTSAARAIKASFANVKIHQWNRPGDGMPNNRSELFPIMQFLAQNLRSRAGIPVDAHELG